MAQFADKVDGTFSRRAKRYAARMLKSPEFWAGFIAGFIIGAALL